jgi:hypothetical protein
MNKVIDRKDYLIKELKRMLEATSNQANNKSSSESQPNGGVIPVAESKGENETFAGVIPVAESKGENETFAGVIPVAESKGENETLAGVIPVAESKGENETLAGVIPVAESKGEDETLAGVIPVAESKNEIQNLGETKEVLQSNAQAKEVHQPNVENQFEEVFKIGHSNSSIETTNSFQNTIKKIYDRRTEGGKEYGIESLNDTVIHGGNIIISLKTIKEYINKTVNNITPK